MAGEFIRGTGLQPVAFGYSRTLGRTRPKMHERSDAERAYAMVRKIAALVPFGSGTSRSRWVQRPHGLQTRATMRVTAAAPRIEGDGLPK